MPERKFDHLANALYLLAEPAYVFVRHDWDAFLLGCRFTQNLNMCGFCDLHRAMGSCRGDYEWDGTSKNREECHVSLDEGHIHETAFYEANKLLINAQSNVCRSKDDCLSFLYVRFLHADVLV